MKNALLYSSIILMAFASCKKTTDRIFNESPNQRIAKVLDAYEKQLTDATNGWKFAIRSADNITFGFYMKFNSSNRITMLSDFDPSIATSEFESSYRLKALQQPSLIFDTYSYLHILADPDPSVAGGKRGQGYRTDFEFYFDTASNADTIKLVGRFNGSKAMLIKATAQEAAAYDNGELLNAYTIYALLEYLQYFKRVTINGVEYEINVNLNDRTIIFTWLDGTGQAQTFSTGFYLVPNGVALFEPLINGTTTIRSFDNLTWNNATTTLGFTVNGTATTVRGAAQPVKADVDAPRRWWQYSFDRKDYWYSIDGFHVNGVDDAFGVNTIPRYYYCMYRAAQGTGGGATLDASGVYYINAAGTALNLYAPAYYPPTFTDDGRIKFSYFGGTFGTNPGGSASAVLSQMVTLMVQSDGFYLVQTGPTQYDMVSAKDGKAWITWLF